MGIDLLGGDSAAAPVAARHATPVEFHQLLQQASSASTKTTPENNNSKETVLIDCRNIYETRIGRFEAEGVTTLDPTTRAFSELPAWLEANVHRLAGKRVLMSCTGGVRCERASAYLRSLGDCFQGEDDVVQLQGGIERYVQQFQNKGFFKGKNFVFDERGDVAAATATAALNLTDGGDDDDDEVLGICCACCTPWGDYSARARCSACRMLILLCDTCAAAAARIPGDTEEEDEDEEVGACEHISSPLPLLCELCKRRATNALPDTERSVNGEQTSVPPPPVLPRILCLHGFRQTAKNFQSRTAALRKRLKNVAELVFIDAPHTLPYSNKDSTKDDKDEKEEEEEAASEHRYPRKGWLLIPEQYNSNDNAVQQNTSLFDSTQYQKQTCGWRETIETIARTLEEKGPFAGCLGFSQGAAVAAVLAALEGHRPVNQRRFKFVVLCSSYLSAVPEHQLLLQHWRRSCKEGSGIPLPSLHVYGITAGDGGGGCEPDCKAVWECFDASKRVLLRQGSGAHMQTIPRSKAATARVAEFIEWSI